MKSQYQKFCYSLYDTCRNIIVPGLNNSQYEYKDLLMKSITPDTKWLDLGCGHEFFPSWMTRGDEAGNTLVRNCGRVVGIDCDVPSVKNNLYILRRLVGDGSALPFQSESFSLVTANMVMEHIEYPDLVLGEIARVLQPGGMFIFHTPNYRNYMTKIAALLSDGLKLQLIRLLEGRKEFDVFPTFYRFNVPKVILSHTRKANLEVQDIILTKSSAETIMLGPVVIVELLLTKLCEWTPLRSFRSIIIGVIKKP